MQTLEDVIAGSGLALRCQDVDLRVENAKLVRQGFHLGPPQPIEPAR
jgi:hypothetical protein